MGEEKQKVDRPEKRLILRVVKSERRVKTYPVIKIIQGIAVIFVGKLNTPYTLPQNKLLLFIMNR